MSLAAALERTRSERTAALRDRYRVIVLSVAESVAARPLGVNESTADRLNPESVADLLSITDTLQVHPDTFDADVSAVLACRAAAAELERARAALVGTRPLPEFGPDIAIESEVLDIVNDVAGLPLIELEAGERRRRAAERAVELADGACVLTRQSLSPLMAGAGW